ncbi:MAG: hypothetical protein ABH826_05605 [Patescibacteria group bacterium]
MQELASRVVLALPNLTRCKNCDHQATKGTKETKRNEDEGKGHGTSFEKFTIIDEKLQRT